MFLLDTDHISVLQRRSGADFVRLKMRMSRRHPTQIYVPIISFHEQMIGWHGYIQRATTARDVAFGYEMLDRALGDFAGRQIATFDAAAAAEFESLRAQRVRIGTMDLRIGAIALTRRFTLLSRNLVDFQKMPGLVVEDWTRA